MLEKILETLRTPHALGEPDFADARYKRIAFSEKNFHEIVQAQEAKETKAKKVCFVDGGNNEVIKTPSLSVQLVKAYANAYNGRQKMRESVFTQFLSVTRMTSDDSQIFLETQNHLLHGSEQLVPTKAFRLNSLDSSLALNGFRASVSTGGVVARRYSEWLAASAISQAITGEKIVVRDGTLQTSVVGESEYARDAYEKISANGGTCTALSKTSELLTTTGYSLINAVEKLAPAALKAKTWVYHPLFENTNADHPAEITIARLHEESTHSFRIEVHSKARESIHEALAGIAQTACDPVFPGFPYGAIDAHLHARVMDNEVASVKQLIKTNAETNAVNAHEIIDGI